MSVVFAVACGPYTDSENLEYGPLIRFMENISDKVNSLILIGPLVDAENKMILRGHVNSQMFGCTSGRYEDLFDNIMKYIKSRFKEVIIVPSYREMTHFYPLPQLPYDGCIAPGPCTLKIKDVSIGVVPYDL